jgi:hypothetical protein
MRDGIAGRQTLVAERGKAGRGTPVAIEATFGWYWAVDALRQALPGAEPGRFTPLANRVVPASRAVPERSTRRTGRDRKG